MNIVYEDFTVDLTMAKLAKGAGAAVNKAADEAAKKKEEEEAKKKVEVRRGAGNYTPLL